MRIFLYRYKSEGKIKVDSFTEDDFYDPDVYKGIKPYEFNVPDVQIDSAIARKIKCPGDFKDALNEIGLTDDMCSVVFSVYVGTGYSELMAKILEDVEGEIRKTVIADILRNYECSVGLIVN